MHPEEVLICKIFEQAIEDYRFLREKNLSYKKSSYGMYSIKDIELFFCGSWCARLLKMIDSTLVGADIMHELQVKYG